MVINGQKKLRYQRNIVNLYNDATIDSIIEGISWYQAAHDKCQVLSRIYDVPLQTVCQVMAILSPATSWENNIKSATAMIAAHKFGKTLDDFKVTTYGANKKKAWNVLKGLDSFTKTDSNHKIYSFYRNIHKPKEARYVTVDRHAIKVLEGNNRAGSVAITPKQYRIASRIYRETAKYYGVRPHELQAILWVLYKKKVGR